MAINFTSGLLVKRNRREDFAKILTVFMIFLSISRGVSMEGTSPLSSQRHDTNFKIGIQISELMKETKTLDSNILSDNINNFKKSAAISTTELLIDNSYIDKAENVNEKSTAVNLKNNFDFKSQTNVKRDSEKIAKNKDFGPEWEVRSKYYEVVKPTKTITVKGLSITQTDINNDQNPGEVEGVSMSRSRPQKSEKMSFNRVKRGFGNSLEEDTDNQKKKLRNGQVDENQNNSGKNYNKIAKTLEKIAKVTVNNDQNASNTTVDALNNFRESREEENRKASPDIQDIITGIVNILNGKGTKQSDSHAARPARPTSTRINNRGPPRISDVPPLDFDGPPAYRPLPPKRIPPPYPFDVPPTPPNIPLPPQPHKPGLSKLPSHPFIEGVPIPELVIPGRPVLHRPYEHVRPEYDTISVSEPMDADSIPVIDLSDNPKPEIAQSTFESTTQRNETSSNGILENSTEPPNTNYTATNVTLDYGKVKPSGQKSPSNTSSNKNSTKKVKPNPVILLGENYPDNKTTTSTPVAVESSSTTENYNQKESEDVSEPIDFKTNQTDVVPTKENASKNETELKIEFDGPFVPSPNISAIFLHLTTEASEVSENKTEKPTSELQKTTTEETTTTTSAHNETKYEEDSELPILLDPSIGIGEATPVLESSIPDLSSFLTEHTSTPTMDLNSIKSSQPSTTTESSHHFKARPGIVLDDPEYKPGVPKRPLITARPIATTPPPHGYYGEIFDVTVHAIQGPGSESSSGKPYIIPIDVDGVQVQNSQNIKGDVSVITKPEEGQKFVSIDGKRTYINLFGEVSPTKINPSTVQPTITGTGYAIPHKESSLYPPTVSRPSMPTSSSRRPYKRPSHPPVRIDTCIVGDDSTCDSAQNEMCRTEDGVSSCHCRPGYNRKKHRDTCRRVVSMLTSVRVDRLYDRKVQWQENLRDPDSEDYQQLSYEASQAIESAMSMTPFSDDFINSRINSIYVAKNLENNEPAVYVNLTLHLEENLDTTRPAVKQDIQRHLLRVIQRRNNNVGNSAVWVNAPSGSVLALQDVDECSSADLHDCHERAICTNTFGSFKCQCPSGSRDPWVGNIHREGRYCEMCPSDYCNSRGECKFEHGQQVCHCSGSFYGTQCEIDGEVLGVAIGASVAAAIIIILTLICLCMWSRRWSREQKSVVGAGMGSPVFGYMATGPTVKTPSVGAPPYQVSMEDRIRWAQIADVMAKSNHYGQAESAKTNTRTNFGGYPTLQTHTMSVAGTLPLPAMAPPVPLPRLTLTNKPVMGTYGAHSQLGSVHQSNHGIRSSVETTSSSEEEDRADLLGRNFNAPRPKSRTSVANQSGIYYDVDYDRSDAYSKQNTIPMNTYTLNPQHQVRPYFR